MSLFYGPKRFKEISRDLPGITDKMLSKELKDLEANLLLKRTVQESFPPRVDYALTDHGQTLKQLIAELGLWGSKHRKHVMKKAV
ncbi:winged helix-turn-helix transcriptional regulator [Chitinophaga sedimenti]|uniref:winged helix-turn-helix transcriptional regulator n=1 Tax=Chitinophaga sedimenti TaxID=2033606 RepID=UPI002004D425|nr:winged helix-turn-helix transcriptional regulator [Chitinophaga sedimenti]MCK7555913.1 winged helix-turn-helix transcriptional regulator [Chitinophaga sedimenti]